MSFPFLLTSSPFVLEKKDFAAKAIHQFVVLSSNMHAQHFDVGMCAIINLLEVFQKRKYSAVVKVVVRVETSRFQRLSLLKMDRIMLKKEKTA